MDWLGYESTAFTLVFVGSFLLLALVEGLRPAHPLSQPAERRWLAHGALFAGGAALQAIVLRTSPVLMAMLAAQRPWGVLHQPWLPEMARFALAILLLDLVRYFTHRLFHAFGWLWRIHEVHHSDSDYDVSTAARFHPLEVVGAKALYVGAVALLAPPVAAVFVAEIHTALLNTLVHANISFPPAVERLARLAFITPDLHRIHHSLDIADQNRNFGQTFVWWDWAFGTYAPAGHTHRTGVAGLPAARYRGIAGLFAAPFERRRP